MSPAVSQLLAELATYLPADFVCPFPCFALVPPQAWSARWEQDITVGTWMLGLDVDYVNERRMCCANAEECEKLVRSQLVQLQSPTLGT